MTSMNCLFAPSAILRDTDALRRLSQTTAQRPARGRRCHVVKASNSEREASRNVLNAFFLGRAFAQSVTEKAEKTLGELLSEVAKADAERRKLVRDFQVEVRTRADEQIYSRVKAGSASSPAASSPYSSPSPKPSSASASASARPEPVPGVKETVEGLRNEVAEARAAVERLKQAKKINGDNGDNEIEIS
eukprot:jgi/Mesvir1/4177/Mv08893-RA.1